MVRPLEAAAASNSSSGKVAAVVSPVGQFQVPAGWRRRVSLWVLDLVSGVLLPWEFSDASWMDEDALMEFLVGMISRSIVFLVSIS